MPHSFGYRARTRHMFSQSFRKKGPVNLSKYMTHYHVGDYVDIKANASIHKGMPHKYYHGKTGIVFNVTPRAIGVEVNKLVGGRILAKRLHVRVEHVTHSTCRSDFLARVKENELKRAEAKAKGVAPVGLKRSPGWPQAGKIVRTTAVETVVPLKYELVM
eukprot:TRINITY_DN7185_c1_g1_i1.p1 TRINITY_DN7185_c1_g1~~TRINITY_DN7185_c1_g1_i1.p1  ORF type:complete len:160 (+),score=37.19 TRINITY_DN7185_c1_g1_i1:25-504(+)